MCADNASTYNHCAICGNTYDTSFELLDHLDEHLGGTPQKPKEVEPRGPVPRKLPGRGRRKRW